MRKKPSQKRSDAMDLTSRFLEVLSETLDLDKTIEKLNITREAARSMLIDAAGSRAKARPGSGIEGPVNIYVDGASRGNPGSAGAGAIIKAKDGRVLKRLKKYLGVVTNNAAEYEALVMALKAARSMGLKKIRMHADSELVVKQIKGVYRVRSEELRPFYTEAMELIDGFNRFEITHVPREKNSEADRLANEAIDGKHT